MDIAGNFWDTVFDIASLCYGIYDVWQNPDDPMAWVGLVGDVIDIAVPFVSGVGETARLAKYSDELDETAGAVYRFATKADDAVASTNTGWKVGEDVTKKTKAGKDPSWSTVRQRVWKNEAYYNPMGYTSENLARMRQGKAPLVLYPENGELYSMELHHVVPRREHGSNEIHNLLILPPWEHDKRDPFRIFKP